MAASINDSSILTEQAPPSYRDAISPEYSNATSLGSQENCYIASASENLFPLAGAWFTKNDLDVNGLSLGVKVPKNKNLDYVRTLTKRIGINWENRKAGICNGTHVLSNPSKKISHGDMQQIVFNLLQIWKQEPNTKIEQLKVAMFGLSLIKAEATEDEKLRMFFAPHFTFTVQELEAEIQELNTQIDSLKMRLTETSATYHSTVQQVTESRASCQRLESIMSQNDIEYQQLAEAKSEADNRYQRLHVRYKHKRAENEMMRQQIGQLTREVQTSKRNLRAKDMEYFKELQAHSIKEDTIIAENRRLRKERDQAVSKLEAKSDNSACKIQQLQSELKQAKMENEQLIKALDKLRSGNEV